MVVPEQTVSVMVVVVVCSHQIEHGVVPARACGHAVATVAAAVVVGVMVQVVPARRRPLSHVMVAVAPLLV